MTIENLTTIPALEAFLQGSQPVIFNVLGGKTERYQFIQKQLVKFRYTACSKKNKGIIIQYLLKMTGYSRQQMTRLIKKYTQTGKVRWTPSTGNGFSKKYQTKDIMLLAKMDERHETPCGHAVKKLCERAYRVFNDENYSDLANISVSHLYNLRHSKSYQNQRRCFTKTNPRQIAIGERKKPQPEGKPGYIRIDTVHQGDQDKVKGVYHINAVDEETQFEIVCSVERISEQYLLPVLEQMLAAFPFKIINFHSDNGSEYINKPVLELLNKLLIDFTKSRSRHSNDNALAESKNASIVRKAFGYQHISKKWANKINIFNINFLNPYINFHRPCFFPEIITDEKGKQKKIYEYKNMMTPYDKLKSLPDSEKYLKPEVTFSALDEFAMKMSDNESAELLLKERQKLFTLIPI
jgi:hypothetical protein